MPRGPKAFRHHERRGLRGFVYESGRYRKLLALGLLLWKTYCHFAPLLRCVLKEPLGILGRIPPTARHGPAFKAPPAPERRGRVLSRREYR
jgi:hypothetical protein